jgi:hypothetical protein
MRDEIKACISLRLKKPPIEEAVEERLNITAACPMTHIRIIFP